METGKIKFTAGLDGIITCALFNDKGLSQNLAGCSILFNVAYENESDCILSLPMTIVKDNMCLIKLSPSDTEFLSMGEYEFQLIITDQVGKEHGTNRVKLEMNRPIK